jgi:hypothetical protein
VGGGEKTRKEKIKKKGKRSGTWAVEKKGKKKRKKKKRGEIQRQQKECERKIGK